MINLSVKIVIYLSEHGTYDIPEGMFKDFFLEK